MSVYKGNKMVAGGRQVLPLLTFIWSDCIKNDISWLRADTFSWQSGTVYTAVYQHLVDDIDSITAESETVGGITISFYRAPDGHKITTDESAVLSIYNATGVAWYYILDTTNQRFKLPRTKFGFTGIRTGVGGYVDAGLPNITGNVNLTGSGVTTTPLFNANDVADSALYNNVSITAGRYHNDSNTGSGYNRIEIDASRSSSIYKDGATVQPPATEMYLYFYVGQFTQTAIEQTAGINAETLNGKVDKGHQVVEYQEPTAANNYTWYKKYADGWVEQGGCVPTVNDGVWTITLPVAMADAHYTSVITREYTNYSGTGTDIAYDAVWAKTSTNFKCWEKWTGSIALNWQVSGVAA